MKQWQRITLSALVAFLLATTLLLGAFSHPSTAHAEAGSYLLNAGEVLQANQFLQSSNGKYTLWMQSDGNFVLYGSDRVIWQSGTAGSGGVLASMQGDGNLVIYNSASQPLWWSGTQGNPGAWLDVQDDGNMVIYNTASQPLWVTNTAGELPWKCWTVYHDLAVSYGGWLTFGRLHIQAHVCSDGQYVWLLDNGGSKPQCWTDNGIMGSARPSWCGIEWFGNTMQIGANMSTHAVMTWSVGILSAGHNIDTQPWLRSLITPDYPNPIDHGVAGACDVWWTACVIN